MLPALHGIYTLVDFTTLIHEQCIYAIWYWRPKHLQKLWTSSMHRSLVCALYTDIGLVCHGWSVWCWRWQSVSYIQCYRFSDWTGWASPSSEYLRRVLATKSNSLPMTSCSQCHHYHNASPAGLWLRVSGVSPHELPQQEVVFHSELVSPRPNRLHLHRQLDIPSLPYVKQYLAQDGITSCVPSDLRCCMTQWLDLP